MVRGANMKKIILIPVIFLIIISLTACSNKTNSDLNHFESKLDEVNHKQDKLHYDHCYRTQIKNNKKMI